MVIVIVDNDMKSLHNLENYIRACRKDDEIVSFADAVEAMEYIRQHEVEILFTEVQMKDVTGFALTKCMKDRMPNSYVIFVTESPEYAMHAWEAHVSSYLLKPVDMQKVQTELEYAALN